MGGKRKSAARRLAWVYCNAAQSLWSFRRQTLGTLFRGSIFADIKTLYVKAWIQRLQHYRLVQMRRIHFRLSCKSAGACFDVSWLTAACFLQCVGEERNGKDSDNWACHNYLFVYIRRVKPSATCWSKIARKLLFARSSIFYLVSCIT